MTDQAFLLDLGRCIGCQACVVACKTGNELPRGAQLISLAEVTRGTFPVLEGGWDNRRCYHCADAACVDVCPTRALFKEDGLTRLDRSICSGCGYCVEACPFDVPAMVDGLSSKCDGCAAAVGAGGQPWCVTTCPSRALEYGDREDIVAKANARALDLRERYPNASVYGETEAGGLGMLVVTPDEPEFFGLPTDPGPALVTGVWQQAVQPLSVVAIALTAIGAGVAALIARRNHLAEVRQLEAQGPGEE